MHLKLHAVVVSLKRVYTCGAEAKETAGGHITSQATGHSFQGQPYFLPSFSTASLARSVATLQTSTVTRLEHYLLKGEEAARGMV